MPKDRSQLTPDDPEDRDRLAQSDPHHLKEVASPAGAEGPTAGKGMPAARDEMPDPEKERYE